MVDVERLLNEYVDNMPAWDATNPEELTQALRSSPEPYWTTLRQFLQQHGIRPEYSMLTTIEPDDVDYEQGIIVTFDKSANPLIKHFWFGYYYPKDGEPSFGIFD
jgi:hypothetical protein